MQSMKPYPLERGVASRHLCREVAIAIITAMQETDVSFAALAKALGGDEDSYRRRVVDLLEGKGGDTGLPWISDVFFALGLRVRFRLEDDPQRPDDENGLPGQAGQ